MVKQNRGASQNETVWLSQAQLSELFDKDRRTVAEHIQNIFKEKELEESVSGNSGQLPQMAKIIK